MKNATLRQLRVFEAVARHLSVTRAAEELHLTPPAVSIQIRQLEGHAKAPLFERLGRGMRLTAAGEATLGRAREILGLVRDAEEAIAGLGSIERGLLDIRVHDLRNWGIGRHRSVDDAPYGGGAGMVLRPEPVASALDELRRPESYVILLDPGGEVFRQARAADLASREHLVLVCPR